MDNNWQGLQATVKKHEIELMKQQLLPPMSEDIEAALKRLNESVGESRCSIFRVSQAVAGGIAEACRPRMVSIGPYHHGESELEMFQGHKWRYLPSMLGRTQSNGICLEKLINVVAPKEKIIRQCYSESIDNFNGSDLVKMMVVDGCFIIEFFRELSKLIPYLDSPLLYNTYVKAFVMQDILRLENQVPYFVLHVLFETTNVPEGTSSLADLSFNFFSCFLKVKGLRLERRIHLRGVHLLNLFHLSLIPSDQQDNQVHQYSSFHMIRSASKLRRVGIGFKTIGIPKIAVDDDDLNWILPNMIAFEQCRGQKASHITAYAMFMGSLVHTVDDVQLLRNYKVISNHGMSNEDLARFFGNIRKAAPSDVKGSYLASEHIMHLRLA
ncbi:hypothetical protein BT93_L0611 [Corymbia citriodora subsp. variegata]|uniref:Uncharacterized protein n=1 Tax=Corymbia citriodora subsp. variegata TaxID=360336 RepID=A0A8T0CPL4_CORYI|nr:hypothetical protein BT93_L0611 [Corymbia citriodora subsp. variegata]